MGGKGTGRRVDELKGTWGRLGWVRGPRRGSGVEPRRWWYDVAEQNRTGTRELPKSRRSGEREREGGAEKWCGRIHKDERQRPLELPVIT